jgi:hypothetical protein
MDIDVLFWLTIAGIVVVAWAQSVDEPTRALAEIFRYGGMLLPTGVQEDDDTQWSWSRVSAERRPQPEAPASPPDDEPELTPDVGAVRYRVRSAADRWRS